MPLRPLVSDNDHVQGPAQTLIELVEYGDYQCPHCGRAYPIVKQIKEKMKGELRFVFRNFPLTKIHFQAKAASIATEAAGRQGKFWEMHDMVFEHQTRLHDMGLREYAQAIGLDMDRFREDMNDPTLIRKVELDFESGLRSGVNATPTFFINGQKYEGSWEGDHLEEFLRNKLDELRKG